MMLTTSCKTIPKSGAGGMTLSLGRKRAEQAVSLDFIGFPAQHAGNLVAVPLVDAIVESRAEEVVFGPLDWPAAQAFGVDLQIFHGGAHLGGICGPACAFKRGFNRHAADPPFGHGLRGKLRTGLAGSCFD